MWLRAVAINRFLTTVGSIPARATCWAIFLPADRHIASLEYSTISLTKLVLLEISEILFKGRKNNP